jgi:hypothetical protein
MNAVKVIVVAVVTLIFELWCIILFMGMGVDGPLGWIALVLLYPTIFTWRLLGWCSVSSLFALGFLQFFPIMWLILWKYGRKINGLMRSNHPNENP